MNTQQKVGKRATRGQRQIHEENKQTLLSYLMASICSFVLVFSLNHFLFRPTTEAWVGFAISATCQLFALAMMSMMMKTVRNEKHQVVDAGLDINDPSAFGEYCKDTVILAVLCQLLSLLSAKLFLLLLAIPAFALYKLWTLILGPWFFAPAPDEAADEREEKKRQKRAHQQQKFMTVRR